MSQTVAILGASQKPERYSYKAFKMLKEYGHKTLLISPKMAQVEGEKVFGRLSEVPPGVDTLTMYVGPEISQKLKDDILRLKPKRVIFNPGSENPNLEESLKSAGIKVLEACTLVLLKTEQFEKD